VRDVKPLASRRTNGAEKAKEEAEPVRKKRKTSSPVTVVPEEPVDELDEGHYDADGKEILLSSGGKPVGLRSPKRERAKDEGWEDLDAEDEGDPAMVSEYVVDAFNYMMRIEVSSDHRFACHEANF
jgi:G2/mitotic-specific cyclin 1/2